MRSIEQSTAVEHPGMAVDGALSMAMGRRPALRLLERTGATEREAGATAVEAGGATVRQLATASDLLPRAQPSAVVLAAIPEGATVLDLGEGTNGYRKVGYDGEIGWMLAEDLA